MLFVYGTAAMVAAILTLGFARYAVTRFEQTSWFRRLAATEVLAMAITTAFALGLALLASGVARDSSSLGLTEMGASLGVIALSVVAVVRMLRVSRSAATTVAPVSPPKQATAA